MRLFQKAQRRIAATQAIAGGMTVGTSLGRGGVRPSNRDWRRYFLKESDFFLS